MVSEDISIYELMTLIPSDFLQSLRGGKATRLTTIKKKLAWLFRKLKIGFTRPNRMQEGYKD